MENNIESMELEEMRQQMTALKKQLDEQLQLNEDRLQKSIIEQNDSMHSEGSRNLIIGIVGSIVVPSLLDNMYNFSLPCLITTSVFILADAIYNYWSFHRIKTADLSTKGLTEIIKTLISMKKMNAKETVLVTILFIPLCYWYLCEFFNSHFYDIVKHSDRYEFFCYFSICALIVGLIIGAWLTIYHYKKQRRKIDKMIETLQEGTE